MSDNRRDVPSGTSFDPDAPLHEEIRQWRDAAADAFHTTEAEAARPDEGCGGTGGRHVYRSVNERPKGEPAYVWKDCPGCPDCAPEEPKPLRCHLCGEPAGDVTICRECDERMRGLTEAERLREALRRLGATASYEELRGQTGSGDSPEEARGEAGSTEHLNMLWRNVQAARDREASEIRQAFHEMREAIRALRAENERLREALLRHVCNCGPTNPSVDEHREDCPYRLALAAPQEQEGNDGR